VSPDASFDAPNPELGEDPREGDVENRNGSGLSAALMSTCMYNMLSESKKSRTLHILLNVVYNPSSLKLI